MKLIQLLLLSIILTTPNFVYGQNYQPIYSNSFQVFYQDKYFDGVMDHSNMWGIRIDSVDISPLGDTIIHNYPICRDSVLWDPWDTECLWWEAPNLNGSATRIDSTGNSWFYNKHGYSILIVHSATLGQQWVCYQYENGDTLFASIDAIDHIDDGWVVDSVKTIGFTRSMDGAVVPDSINGTDIQVYRSNGIRKFIDIAEFPLVLEPIYAVDPELINRNAPGYITGENAVPEPSVGDYFYSSYHTYDNYSPYSSDRYQSREIVSVSAIGSTDSLSVIQQNWKQTRHTTLNYDVPPPAPFEVVDVWSDVITWFDTLIYFPIPDSFVTYWRGNDGRNYMPRENRAGYNYSVSNLAGCTLPLVGIHSCNDPIELQENQSDSCINSMNPTAEFFCQSGTNVKYNQQIGWISNYTISWDTPMSSDESRGGIHYFKVGDMECGIYSVVGLEEVDISHINEVYPNPAQGFFHITSDLSIENIEIHNVQGQCIWQSSDSFSQKTIDCSQWPNGLYVIQMASNGQAIQKKVIVSH